MGSREPEAAEAEPEPGEDLEPGVRATERELLEHIEADDPELADAIAHEHRDVIVANEHQVDGEILDSCREIVLAVLDAQPGVTQQIAAEVGQPSQLLDRQVEPWECRHVRHFDRSMSRRRSEENTSELQSLLC